MLQEGGDIWNVISFMEESKNDNPGVDYRVKYDSCQRPEGVCWIFPEMREDLICFGDILFLDAQKKDYNKPSWPYIGPCVKSEEMEVAVVTECIIISESIDNYAWLLFAMVDMEPRFSLSQIKLIFADQLVTHTILDKLQIWESCVLHGDWYHNLNKVFPETFGRDFDGLCPYLKTMLDAMTECEWDSNLPKCS